MFKLILRFIPLIGITCLTLAMLILAGVVDPLGLGDSGGENVMLFIFCVVVGLFGTIASVSSVFSHISELGELRSYEEKITDQKALCQIAKDEAKRVADQLDNMQDAIMALDESLLAKAADHPIVAAMENAKDLSRRIVDAEEKVTEIKRRKSDTAALIESRKIGPFGWVVEAYGEK